MRFIAQHIIFILIFTFAFNVDAYSEEISSPLKHSEYDCECCALSETNIVESKEDECTSCCCAMQQEEDVYFSPVSSLTEVYFPGILIVDREKNNANSSVSFLKYRLIHFRVTKTSFPFLQVILA